MTKSAASKATTYAGLDVSLKVHRRRCWQDSLRAHGTDRPSTDRQISSRTCSSSRALWSGERVRVSACV